MRVALLAAEAVAAGALSATCGQGQEGPEPAAVEYRVGAEMNVSVSGTTPEQRCRVFEHGLLTIVGKNVVKYEGSKSDGKNGECVDGTTFTMVDEEVRATDTLHDTRQQEITERRAGLFKDPTNIRSGLRITHEITESGAGTVTALKENEEEVVSANPEHVGAKSGIYSKTTTCRLGEKAVLLQLGNERLTGGGVLIAVISKPADKKGCEPGTVFVRR